MFLSLTYHLSLACNCSSAQQRICKMVAQEKVIYNEKHPMKLHNSESHVSSLYRPSAG
jgi:hypothetical protein